MTGVLGGNRNQTTTQQIQLPPHLAQASQQNTDLANQIAAGNWPAEIGPFPRYTGQRFANASPMETQAGTIAQGLPGMDMSGPASQIALSAGQRFGGNFIGPEYNAQTLGQYINPNLDAIFAEVRRNGDRNRAQITAQAAARRSLGGSGEAIQTQEAAGNEQRTIGTLTAQEYGQGAQRFMADQGRRLQEMSAQAGQFNTENNRGLQLAQTLMGIGQQRTGIGAEQARLLSALGLQERGRNQQPLDFDYQQFTEARDWPQRMLQLRLQALAGQPNQSSTTITAPSQSGSGVTQALGGAVSLGRLFGLF